MTETILTISSKNYSSWSLRGWLLCRMAGLKFVEEVVPVDDPANRAELLLLSPSILTSTSGTSDLTVTINSYTGTTTTQTSTPVASQDRLVINMSYNAAKKVVLPSSTLLGITFPSTLTAADSQLYE